MIAPDGKPRKIHDLFSKTNPRLSLLLNVLTTDSADRVFHIYL
jgi:hypothetical protein